MRFSKKDLFILIVPLIITAILYLFLPAKIPKQFHFGNEPTSYMNKEFIFLFAFLPIVIYKYSKYKKSR